VGGFKKQIVKMNLIKSSKATRIDLFSLKTIQMRTFHLTWFAFFLCFFGWFGIAPLMGVVREELGLTKPQIGNIIIASVAITIFARLLIGWLCDKIGSRISYTIVLLVSAIPVIGIGLSYDYTSFLLFRLAIGVIGASFVITQYHTSMMFAPNVVGTANATTAGWGNLGGGVTQMVMPLIFALFIGLGFVSSSAWRLAMVVPGVALIITAALYFFFTKDFPEGNLADIRKKTPELISKGKKEQGAFWAALKDYRVWILFLIYGGCFGVELTLNNIAAIYFQDYFKLDITTAGIIAGLFGLMNLFARSLGGIFGDKAGIKWGLKGRVLFMGIILFLEGISLIIFSQMGILVLAIISMVIFSLFVQMAEGATFSVVPFINKKAVGVVSGVVGAGGNAGAVSAGFLFGMESLSYPQALLIMGVVVIVISITAVFIKFSPEAEAEAKAEMDALLATEKALAVA
jgi:MFS transporter, NNP family, nitrate/nitrite transporter